MKNPILRAQHYLDQAETMQRLACDETDPVSREALLDLAKSYTRLAARFLQIGKDTSEREH